MSFNTAITAQTMVTRAIADQIETAICEAEKYHVSSELQCAIDAIPFQIAAADALGSNSTKVIALTESEDFIVPEHVDPYKSERPFADWLQGDAAWVYRYCLEAGLSPSLEPFVQPTLSKLQSALTIDWTRSALYGPGDIDFNACKVSLDAVCTRRVRIPYEQQDAVRKRVARVLQLAPEILHNARVARQGQSKNSNLLCVVDVEGSEQDSLKLMSDLRILCNIFELPVQFQPARRLRLDQPMKRFSIFLNLI